MKPQAGFTLLEILVALVIVTTVFMVCFLSMTEMTKNTVVLTEKTFAVLVANREIAIAKLKVPSQGEGNVKQVMGDLNYLVRIQRQQSGQADIDQIEATVLNNQGSLILNEKGYQFVPPKKDIRKTEQSVHTD